MKTETFHCSCHDANHTFSFEYDEGDNYMFMVPYLSTSKGFWHRLKDAIKYVFGFEAPFGHFDEVLLQEAEVVRLRNYLHLVLDEMKKASVQGEASNLLWVRLSQDGTGQISSEDLEDVIAGINKLLRDGKLEVMDRILRDADPSTMAEESISAYLRVTFNFRDQLSYWNWFRANSYKHLLQLGYDPEKIHKGLD